jgi:tetratricopeptide (TPR) repeat protein
MRTGVGVFSLLAAAFCARESCAQSAQNTGWQLTGKVVIEGVGVPPQPVDIESFCNGVAYISGQTDRNGVFGFRVGPNANPAMQDASVSAMDGAFGRPRATLGPPPPVTPDETSGTGQADNPAPTVSRRGAGGDQLLKNCELRLRLAGYRAEPISLATRKSSDGPDLGTIVMRPVSRTAETTVSLSSLAAPARARSSFDKGEKDLQARRPEKAREHFRKAIAIYPGYAEAWCELGKIDVRERRFAEARRSFEAAVKADAKHVEAYLQIASLEVAGSEWQALTETTARVLKLDPTHHIRVWYWSAVANFNIGDLAAAEVSAREAQKLDQRREIPRTWYLLGKILAQRGDPAGSAEQLREYLQMVPQGRDATAARAELARIEAVGRGR